MKLLHTTAAFALLPLLALGAVGAQMVEKHALPTALELSAVNRESVNIVLHDGELSYAVPDGKVLVIESFLWALETGFTHQRVSITPAFDPGVGDFQLKFDAQQPDSFIPETPIRIVGGGTAEVAILTNALVDWRDVMIVGYLIDA